MKSKFRETIFLIPRTIQLDHRFLHSNIGLTPRSKLYFLILKYSILLFHLLVPFRMGTNYVRWNGSRLYYDNRIAGVAGYQAILSEHISWIHQLEPPAPGQLIIDAGANVGYFSKAIKAAFPECQILAFEPAPESVATFLKNNSNFVLRKDNDQVTEKGNFDIIHRTALGNFRGYSELLQISGASALSKLASSESETLGSAVSKQVPITMLEDVLDGSELRQSIYLVKIDTEGYELEVLKGMGKYIRNVRYLHCELNSNAWLLSDLFKILDRAGMVCKLINVRNFDLDSNAQIINGDFLLELSIVEPEV